MIHFFHAQETFIIYVDYYQNVIFVETFFFICSLTNFLPALLINLIHVESNSSVNIISQQFKCTFSFLGLILRLPGTYFQSSVSKLVVCCLVDRFSWSVLTFVFQV